MLALPQGMDWLVEKVKNPIQRDADYYYHRAAELRFLGAAGTPTFKDAQEDLEKAFDVTRLNQQGRGAQTKRGQVRPFTQFKLYCSLLFSPRLTRGRGANTCCSLRTRRTVSCKRSCSELRTLGDLGLSRAARAGRTLLQWLLQAL